MGKAKSMLKKISNENIKTNIYIYILAVLGLFTFIFSVYSGFAGENLYSVDSIGMTSLSECCSPYIGSLRPFGAFLLFVISLTGHNPNNNSLIDVLAFCLILSICVVLLYVYIIKKLKSHNFLTGSLIILILLIPFLNVFFSDILTFPECILIHSVAVFCTTVGVILVTSELKKVNKVIGFIMLILAVSIYQTYISVFFVFAVLLILTDCSEEFSLKAVSKRLTFLTLGVVISGIIYVAAAVLAKNIFGVSTNTRAAISVDKICDTVIHLIKSQYSFLKGRGYFESNLLVYVLMLLFAILVALGIKRMVSNKSEISKVITYGVAAVVCYAVLYLPGAITGSINVRAVFSIFSVFSIFALLIILFSERNITKLIVNVLLLLVLVANVYQINAHETTNKLNMNEDQVWAKSVVSEITDYEEENNVKITKLGYCEDEKMASFGTGVRNVDWAIIPCLEYYTGRTFELIDVSESVEAYFSNKDWNEINLTEQMKFEGDTVYICNF